APSDVGGNRAADQANFLTTTDRNRLRQYQRERLTTLQSGLYYIKRIHESLSKNPLKVNYNLTVLYQLIRDPPWPKVLDRNTRLRGLLLTDVLNLLQGLIRRISRTVRACQPAPVDEPANTLHASVVAIPIIHNAAATSTAASTTIIGPTVTENDWDWDDELDPDDLAQLIALENQQSVPPSNIVSNLIVPPPAATGNAIIIPPMSHTQPPSEFTPILDALDKFGAATLRKWAIEQCITTDDPPPQSTAVLSAVRQRLTAQTQQALWCFAECARLLVDYR
ncbi:hypothetical protein BJ085DRAFT_39137, partial [Dimargaris cristalligena]